MKIVIIMFSFSSWYILYLRPFLYMCIMYNVKKCELKKKRLDLEKKTSVELFFRQSFSKECLRLLKLIYLTIIAVPTSIFFLFFIFITKPFSY